MIHQSRYRKSKTLGTFVSALMILHDTVVPSSIMTCGAMRWSAFDVERSVGVGRPVALTLFNSSSDTGTTGWPTTTEVR